VLRFCLVLSLNFSSVQSQEPRTVRESFSMGTTSVPYYPSGYIKEGHKGETRPKDWMRSLGKSYLENYPNLSKDEKSIFWPNALIEKDPDYGVKTVDPKMDDYLAAHATSHYGYGSVPLDKSGDWMAQRYSDILRYNFSDYAKRLGKKSLLEKLMVWNGGSKKYANTVLSLRKALTHKRNREFVDAMYQSPYWSDEYVGEEE
jgi:hypothetical protein